MEIRTVLAGGGNEPKKKKKKTFDPDKGPVVVRTAVDLQRLHLEKLMKNPEKPVYVPERRKEKSFPKAPEFVRNIMGSSAGAGSGEFHVYRHLRRKEYARQDFINAQSQKDELDEEFHLKLEENRQAAEQRTAKKRAKRLKRKEKEKLKNTVKKLKSASISREGGAGQKTGGGGAGNGATGAVVNDERIDLSSESDDEKCDSDGMEDS